MPDAPILRFTLPCGRRLIQSQPYPSPCSSPLARPAGSITFLGSRGHFGIAARSSPEQLGREHVFDLIPIGHVSSPLTDLEDAPKQGREGAPDAWLVFEPEFEDGLRDLRAGDEILVLTWLDRGDRSALRVHPRDDASAPLRGVFSTRSADRPNPVGIHRVRIIAVESPLRFKVSDLEALDSTPIIDIKPVLDPRQER